MKKYVIATLILILVPLYAFDVYMHNWTKSQIYHIANAAFPQARQVQITVGDYMFNAEGRHVFPTPMLPPLTLSHHIPDVTIKVVGANLSNLPVDYWVFSADGVSFDSSQLFNSRHLFIKQISNGNISMAISARSLGNINPAYSVNINENGDATANINGTDVPLTVATTDQAIVFTAAGQPFGEIPIKDARMLPCKPTPQFTAHQLLLSCTTNNVPGALTITVR